MKNIQIKFFLPFLILLFSGYGQSYAHTSKGDITSLSLNSGKMFGSNFENNQVALGLFLKLNQSPDESNFSKLRATDNELEEEEIISSKKVIVVNNYYSSFLTSISADQVTKYLKKSISFDNFLYNFSAYKRYIFFLVIRI